MRKARGFGTIYRRPNRPEGHLWIRWYQGGSRSQSVAQALGKPHEAVTEKDAERLLNARLMDKIKGRFPIKRSVTVNELVNDYWSALQIRGVTKPHQTRSHIDAIKNWFGRERAANLTSARLLRLVQQILSRGYVRDGTRRLYARGAVKNRLSMLRSALIHARDAGKISEVPKLPKMVVRNARRSFFYYEQFMAVHERMFEPSADVALFGYLTGWRVGEILDLKLAEVNLEAGTVRVHDTKTGEGRARPIVEQDLRKLIERRVAGSVVGCPFLFHRHGSSIRYEWFRKQWRTACDGAGLPSMIFHDLRRTAYNDFVSEFNVDLVTAMELTGHKSLSMAKRYNIVDQRRMRLALAQIAAGRERQKLPDNSRTMASVTELKGE